MNFPVGWVTTGRVWNYLGYTVLFEKRYKVSEFFFCQKMWNMWKVFFLLFDLIDSNKYMTNKYTKSSLIFFLYKYYCMILILTLLEIRKRRATVYMHTLSWQLNTNRNNTLTINIPYGKNMLSHGHYLNIGIVYKTRRGRPR